jgi:hypothetical protein
LLFKLWNTLVVRLKEIQEKGSLHLHVVVHDSLKYMSVDRVSCSILVYIEYHDILGRPQTAPLVTASVIYEPCHDKTNIVGLRPTWIQTSLRLRAVWSGSMLFAISFSTCNWVCKRTAWILIRLRECAGWSGSMLVANALRWFCRDVAQISNKQVKKCFKYKWQVH